MKHSLFSIRWAGFLGSAAGWILISGFVGAVALAGSWIMTEYRLREGENALSALLDSHHYRYLSGAAVADAAPGWARDNALYTRPSWVRVRISKSGGGRVAAPSAASEADSELRAAGLSVGRRAADVPLQIAVRLVVEASVFPFVRRRRLEAEYGAEREGEFRLSSPGDAWDDLPDPEALGDADRDGATGGHGLPPLAEPTVPTLAALDAWRTAEQTLARTLGVKTLEAVSSPPLPGPEPRLRDTANALARARTRLDAYLDGPGRAVLVEWLDVSGAEDIEGAVAAMAHLDVVLRAGAADRAAITALLAPYVARATAARTYLGASLARVGVIVP